MSTGEHHQSVLLNETLQGLALRPDGYYVDATFGRGGHSLAILQALGPQGRLWVIDQDPAAIAVAEELFGQDERVVIRHGNFTHLYEWALELGCVGKIDGILLDLGVSSPQLADPLRGFSFQQEGSLDMRMDPANPVSAASWIAHASEHQIARILWEYGEERFSRRIARMIVSVREMEPIVTTSQLANIIAKAVPIHQRGKHPATRSFQAIRILVNQELAVLETVLAQSLEVLAVSGRLVVISFHSLEDGIVKRFMQYWSQGGVPADLVIPEAQLQRRLRPIGRMLRPTESEVQENPRARSARCRIMEKLK